TGTFTLSNLNTYSGTTTINSGTLAVTGEIDSNTTVNSPGTLAGTGKVVGTVTANAGGNVAPGLSPGILTTGSVNFTAGSNFNVELDGLTVGTQYDQLSVTLNP